jgi:hypothetical protein
MCVCVCVCVSATLILDVELHGGLGAGCDEARMGEVEVW